MKETTEIVEALGVKNKLEEDDKTLKAIKEFLEINKDIVIKYDKIDASKKLIETYSSSNIIKEIITAIVAKGTANDVDITKIKEVITTENIFDLAEDIKFIKLNEELRKLLFSVAKTHFYLNNFEESFETFTKLVDIDSSDKMSYFYLGNISLKTQKYNEACEFYEKVIWLDANFKEAFNNLGEAQLKLGKKHEACKNYARALKIDPKYEVAGNNFKVVSESLVMKNENCLIY